MNILFVCSRNKWRSRTAETIYKDNQLHSVRSAGTDEGAQVKINEKLIQWADLIFVMEKKHNDKMMLKFPDALNQKDVVILHIPDDYQYMDEELIEIIKQSVSAYITEQ